MPPQAAAGTLSMSRSTLKNSPCWSPFWRLRRKAHSEATAPAVASTSTSTPINRTDFWPNRSYLVVGNTGVLSSSFPTPRNLITKRPAPVLLWRLMCTMPQPRSCHLQALAASAPFSAAASPLPPSSWLLPPSGRDASFFASAEGAAATLGPVCCTNFHSLHSARKTTSSSSSPVSLHSSREGSTASSSELATLAPPADEAAAGDEDEAAATAAGADEDTEEPALVVGAPRPAAAAVNMPGAPDEADPENRERPMKGFALPSPKPPDVPEGAEADAGKVPPPPPKPPPPPLLP
mmetsp:Transcript_37103/g.105362  ORF Transcript_37103/g.105362 Transcript_37103/m.105362 type:complete len:293 (-) Transcript_37103:38-916(-)